MQKKNLIVFDIDGTLVDSVVQHQQAFRDTLIELGVQEINKSFGSFKHHTDSFISKEIYESNTGEPFIESIFEAFEKGLTQKISKEKFKEIRGAKRLIEELEANTDFGVCYATGSLRKPAVHKLISIGVSFDNQQLVTSDAIYDRETIVEQAIKDAKEFYGVKSFDRIISVGDGLWDLSTAINLGLEFIGVGLVNQKVLKANGANIILDDLTRFQNSI
jgi:phosphoglycolate phosphatase-like HAD superfamily hydrolase